MIYAIKVVGLRNGEPTDQAGKFICDLPDRTWSPSMADALTFTKKEAIAFHAKFLSCYNVELVPTRSAFGIGEEIVWAIFFLLVTGTLMSLADAAAHNKRAAACLIFLALLSGRYLWLLLRDYRSRYSYRKWQF
ncbi:MAG TPA: hypothetical protein VEG64_05660 [Candidatus Sulfotelmatobacter sp.]|nr:hypothetical protein [Candidatus Sulfotelmatobacter sp.]